MGTQQASVGHALRRQLVGAPGLAGGAGYRECGGRWYVGAGQVVGVGKVQDRLGGVKNRKPGMGDMCQYGAKLAPRRSSRQEAVRGGARFDSLLGLVQ